MIQLIARIRGLDVVQVGSARSTRNYCLHPYTFLVFLIQSRLAPRGHCKRHPDPTQLREGNLKEQLFPLRKVTGLPVIRGRVHST